jgi:hypothetical protein
MVKGVIMLILVENREAKILNDFNINLSFCVADVAHRDPLSCIIILVVCITGIFIK